MVSKISLKILVGLEAIMNNCCKTVKPFNEKLHFVNGYFSEYSYDCTIEFQNYACYKHNVTSTCSSLDHKSTKHIVAWLSSGPVNKARSQCQGFCFLFFIKIFAFESVTV